MRLEAQLSELAALGLALEPSVTVEDLLYSFDREAYEKKPFDLLLFILGQRSNVSRGVGRSAPRSGTSMRNASRAAAPTSTSSNTSYVWRVHRNAL